MNYHQRIMNINMNENEREYHGEGYSFGHRDARHVAAEIAAEADAEIERLRTERENWQEVARNENESRRVAERERDKARAGVAVLHHEVKRLREALNRAHLCDCNPAARRALEEAE